jgi:hypothetical protein
MKLGQYVKFREEKFGGAVFETRSEKKVYTLHSPAAAVVREIEAGRDEGEIPGRLREQFRDGGGVIAGEAAAFIAALRRKGRA